MLRGQRVRSFFAYRHAHAFDFVRFVFFLIDQLTSLHYRVETGQVSSSLSSHRLLIAANEY